MRITVYEKPTCSKCREVDKILREAGADYEKINYYVQPIGKDKLRELVKKMNVHPRVLLRTSEQIYKDLGLSQKDLSEEAVIDLLIQHPDLLQRPIVEKGSKAVLARPAENIKAIL
jgi:arsenate reductase